MKILSLFDGMSCGQLALQRLQITPEVYYASEIDKYAISVTQYNFPNTVQLGSVTDWREWEIETPDIILAGSPCQGFSLAGLQLNFDDPRSKLFFDFVDILEHYQPKYFLLENVMMKKSWEKIITDILGVEPVVINSALVSAQNRRRLYWTNLPSVSQPEDREIYLRDIVLEDACEPSLSNVYGGWGENTPRLHYDKSPTLRPSTGGGHVASIMRKEGWEYFSCAVRGRYEDDGSTSQRLETSFDTKANALTSVQKDSLLLSEKELAFMDRPSYDGRTQWDYGWHSDISKPKSACMLKNWMKGVPFNVLKENGIVRKFHPIECERLQTVPDNYTKYGNFDGEVKEISKTQRYKMLGNGWTVDVITHILSTTVAQLG